MAIDGLIEIAAPRSADEARRAYDGSAVQALQPSRAERRVAERDGRKPHDYNASPGIVKTIIDTSLGLLYAEPPRLTVTPDPDTSREPSSEEIASAQRWLDRWVDDSNLGGMLLEAAEAGAWSGRLFVELQPILDEAGAPIAGLAPRLVQHDPTMMRLLVDSDTSQVRGYAKHWTEQHDREVVERRKQWVSTPAGWLIANERRKSGRFSAGAWEEMHAPVLWTYEGAPIATAKNLPSTSAWGRPDIDEAMLQTARAMELTTSNAVKLAHLFAHRALVARGVPGGVELDLTPGSLTTLPAAPQDVSVDVLDMRADVQQVLDVTNQLQASLFATSQTAPVAAGQIDKIGSLTSGLALKIAYGPSASKAHVKQRAHGIFIRQLAETALEIAGWDARNLDVVLRWKDPLPTDLHASAGAAIAMQDAGVSVDTALSLTLPVDPSAEAEARASEEAAEAARAEIRFERGVE
jgi:hypothetical protein